MRSWLAALAGALFCGAASAGSFAVLGDMPYSVPEVETTRAIIADFGRDRDVAFAVHIGDIKGGGERCDDARLTARRDDFNASRVPFVLVPGDNEWTDCHRKSNGGYDPEERLSKVRELFAAGDQSLGQRRMPLIRQGSVQPQYATWRENVRWEFDNTLVIGMNLPGSNNNWKIPGERGGDNHEFTARLAANTAWLADGFRLAREKNLAGVIIAVQADPDFEEEQSRRQQGRPGYRDGYREFKAQLATEARAYGKPVLFVHGDTHTLRIDQPVKDADGKIVPNITRLETFGSPFLGWVKVSVDTTDPALFKIEPHRFNGMFQQ